MGCLVVVAVVMVVQYIVLVVKWLLNSNKLHDIAIAMMMRCKVF